MLKLESCKNEMMIYPVGGLLDVVHGRGSDVGMEGLILPREGATVLVPHLALLHRPLPSNYNARPRLHTEPDRPIEVPSNKENQWIE